jgi:hypothetical protein
MWRYRRGNNEVCTKFLNCKKWNGVGAVAYRENFSEVKKIQLRTKGKENWDLGLVAL